MRAFSTGTQCSPPVAASYSHDIRVSTRPQRISLSLAPYQLHVEGFIVQQMHVLYMQEMTRPRDAHCASCNNAFVFDASTHAAEPDHCEVCGDWGRETEENWLLNEESSASSYRREAQLRFIQGEDPVSVLLEADGWNGAKDMAKRANEGSQWHADLLARVRGRLASGVASFATYGPEVEPCTS